MRLGVVVLAAGHGKRMRSQRPKVLHRLGGRPLLSHVLDTLERLGPACVAVVVGHESDQVRSEFAGRSVAWVEQAERLGTGHAVLCAMTALADVDRVLILYGDVPLIGSATLERLLDASCETECALITARLDDPAGYGRLVRDQQGSIERIVEHRDATPEQLQLDEVNTGIFAVNRAPLQRWLDRLDNRNVQGEYYLTDIVGFAVADGVKLVSVHPDDPFEVMGVNDRLQLAELERHYQGRVAEALMLHGVTLADPTRFDLRGTLDVGRDVEIDVNVIIEGSVTLGEGVRVGAHSVIRDSTIGNDVQILEHCVVEGAVIGRAARIGPFARIRPETALADGVHIGNFVEVKKSTVAYASKINHLSYVGDSSIGRNVNIGAGTITCNYDGARKHRTVIEDNAFIGSDTQLVAPVTVGAGATIGAGSTITSNAPASTLSLSRAPQHTVPGWRRPKKPPTD